MMTNNTPERDETLSAWAEDQMTLTSRSSTALRGEDAARHGRETLARAMGRPALDPDARPGEHARKRQLRLDSELDAKVEALLATGQAGTFSALTRAALREYLERHPLTEPAA